MAISLSAASAIGFGQQAEATWQFTVADAGDAKTIFTFTRRLTDQQWKFQTPPKAAGGSR